MPQSPRAHFGARAATGPVTPHGPDGGPGPTRLVFCDVDETLIRCKSACDFLHFYFAGRFGPDGALRAAEITASLTAQAAQGVPREKLNAVYHRAWRGRPVAEVEDWARRWYATRSSAEDFYLPATLAALRAHRAAGAGIVLVSGAFPAVLVPIGEAVGARHVLGARLERCGRMLTGGLIGPPVIGEAKLSLVEKLLADHPHIDPADCWAYGDHPSDLPMLRAVGHAVMVGPEGTHSPLPPTPRPVAVAVTAAR